MYARQAAVRHGTTLIISPRGTVVDWSLNQKWLRKRLGWHLWEKENFRSASLFHATCDEEAESIRRMGIQTPVAVIPNGVAYPVAGPRPSGHGPRRMLFLSRLHPKKGLDLLVDAWGALWSRFPDWVLDLAGPDEDGYGAAMQQRADRLGIPVDRIRFLGPQYGDAKWDLYRQAELFVLPSHSENFGNVIAEALSQGVPVITTHGTPWAELQHRNCGWWIEVGTSPLQQALAQALALPAEKLASMGGRGRDLVQQQFEWRTVAEAFTHCYQWALDPHALPPPEIHTR